MFFSSVPSALKVSLLDVGEGLLADHLVLLVVGGQEATDTAALSAGVGHELGVCGASSFLGPNRTFHMFIHTALKINQSLIFHLISPLMFNNVCIYMLTLFVSTAVPGHVHPHVVMQAFCIKLNMSQLLML